MHVEEEEERRKKSLLAMALQPPPRVAHASRLDQLLILE